VQEKTQTPANELAYHSQMNLRMLSKEKTK
jgi:hypothetical protein